MADEPNSKKCPRCGAVLPGGVPANRCPTCILKLAFLSDDDGYGSGDPDEFVESSGGLQLRSFGDYELAEEIARGGMGVVYRGVQRSLKRTVAVKMILSGQIASRSAVRRLKSANEPSELR